MAERDDKQFASEEFRFSPETREELEANPFQGEETKPFSAKHDAFGNPSSNRLLSIIGTIIVVFALYKLSTLLFEEGKNKISQSKTTTEVAAPLKPEIKPVPPVVPVTPAPPAIEAVNVPAANIALNTQVNELQNQVTTLSNNVANLQSSLANLSDKLNKIDEQLEKNKPAPIQEKKVIKKKHVQAAKKPKHTYIIRSIMPNRVWLSDNMGKNWTFTEGDAIPGYGKVKVINPVKGTVLTSSGVIIRYGS